MEKFGQKKWMQINEIDLDSIGLLVFFYNRSKAGKSIYHITSGYLSWY